jgi:hypothetical protein
MSKPGFAPGSDNLAAQQRIPGLSDKGEDRHHNEGITR